MPEVYATSVDNVQTMLASGPLKPEASALLDKIIVPGVTRQIERHCLLRCKILQRTQLFTVYKRGVRFKLDHWPVSSITSVKFDPEGNFSAVSALNSSDYTVSERGILSLRFRSLSSDYDWPNALEVISTGGLAASTEDLIKSNEYADLVMAATIQAATVYRRRNDLGLASVSQGSSSITQFTALKLQPGVLELLQDYVRTEIG